MSETTALIYEAVVTSADGASPQVAHVAPMGVRYEGGGAIVVLMPFKPSRTLDNILATRCAVLNLTSDVRVFAGCVTGRRDWPLLPAERVAAPRLAGCLSHAELELLEVQDDAQRPVLRMRCVHRGRHADFAGFNRAQAAVIEGAVLVSRLRMLPAEKIDREFAYLQIAIDKTAGPDELDAWQWLLEAVARHRSAQASSG
jgi:uncharacterized protein